MSSVLLIFCCLLGLGSAWNQPSTCYIRSQCSSETETQLTKISESLLSELKHIREALETIADKLLGKYVTILTVKSDSSVYIAIHACNCNNLSLNCCRC